MDKLVDLANILRSKNAGPLNITFDIILKDNKTFNRVKNSGVINEELISNLYKVAKEDVSILEYEVVNAIKITIPRKYTSGDIKDTDIYGCQQHGPLLKIKIS
ncbi:hypothetical protein ES708_14830 [subsurface metagenome]